MPLAVSILLLVRSYRTKSSKSAFSNLTTSSSANYIISVDFCGFERLIGGNFLMVVASRPLSMIGVFWVVLWIDILLLCSRMGVSYGLLRLWLNMRKLLRQLLCQQTRRKPRSFCSFVQGYPWYFVWLFISLWKILEVHTVHFFKVKKACQVSSNISSMTQNCITV